MKDWELENERQENNHLCRFDGYNTKSRLREHEEYIRKLEEEQ